ncbi:hypothetical protein ASPSYDRAFT_164288 [Aspergillus sydowii CBS 593.65]|uniref:Uncharacterized protein n=1 Tax=Aspergillus sydowii CBS 593.65 TaxID=1036612 RepID=A0A1L9SZU6_9EURO|nr:uncharacterized protein ASPSYDRAFT_164288 [Aspergillus sydowii CBS 593.65]OJJ52677.1 hypothetical protein ASPSYDRAFT_164288 [Aspergillus sydowii CBS 593.65]
MTLLWIAAAFVRWIRLKIYQYEVTFAVYMLTPTEKFIFNSIILTLLSMILTAIYVYLPDHLRTIYGHLYYYWVGERPFVSNGIAAISTVFRDGATQTLELVYETAQNTAATAAATVPEL